MLRGQIFTLNLWSSNGSRTRTCNVRKMSRMYLLFVYEKAKNYLLDVCWTGEETNKVTASNVTSQISSLRDASARNVVYDWPVDRAANRSILQPVICRNKNLFIDGVNMNEDKEGDVDDLASEVETDWTRQKIRRHLAKFRRRLQKRVQVLLLLTHNNK